MDRQYNLAVAVVVKAAELLDVEAATPTQRRQAKEVLDAMSGYILASATKCVRSHRQLGGWALSGPARGPAWSALAERALPPFTGATQQANPRAAG
jgi:hypothetical protein